MKIVTIVGARPQFIKAAAISREIRRHNAANPAKHIEEVLIHTGQHYDQNMSDIFFQELEIPPPQHNLNVGSGTHAEQTAKMLIGIEEILLQLKPNWVLIYGDTNSTLAGALAASKLHIPIAHVEAGLRSFNRHMPEEINRVVADHLSTLLLCPTETAVKNLAQEGITEGVHLVGDVMQDVLFTNLSAAAKSSTVLERLELRPQNYILVTVHRAENTDDRSRLDGIVHALARIAESGETVVFPVHPRTRKALEDGDRALLGKIKLIDPLGYRDIVWLERNARMIMTDSGGVQKEAYWLNVPCAVLREETEWVETISGSGNRLVGSDGARIWTAYEDVVARPRTGLHETRQPTRSTARLHLERILESQKITP